MQLRRMLIGVAASAALVGPAAGAATAGAETLNSTFNTDLDGWVGNGGSAWTAEGKGGVPGGVNLFGFSPLESPASWSGDRSALDGGSLEFDIKTEMYTSSSVSLFGHRSSSLRAARVSTSPGWNHISIPLTEATWQRFWGTDNLHQALSRLSYFSFNVRGIYDNIRLVPPKPVATEVIKGQGVSKIGTNFSLSVTRTAEGVFGGRLKFANPRNNPALREGDVTCATFGTKRAVIGMIDKANASHPTDVYREFYVEDEPNGFRLTGLLNSRKLPVAGAQCRKALPAANTGRIIRSGSMTFAGN